MKAEQIKDAIDKGRYLIWLLDEDTRVPEDLGYLPDIFKESDPRCAVDQVNDRYDHGGGWNPSKSWTYNGKDGTIQSVYPEDGPPLKPWAYTFLHFIEGDNTKGELITVYDHGMVAIVQGDGSYEIARMD